MLHVRGHLDISLCENTNVVVVRFGDSENLAVYGLITLEVDTVCLR